MGGAVSEIYAEPEYLDVSLPAGAHFVQPVPRGHAALAYAFEGEGSFGVGADLGYRGDLDGVLLTAPQMAVFGDGDVVRVEADGSPVRFLLVSGKPLGEPIARYGPFVMNTREELLAGAAGPAERHLRVARRPGVGAEAAHLVAGHLGAVTAARRRDVSGRRRGVPARRQRLDERSRRAPARRLAAVRAQRAARHAALRVEAGDVRRRVRSRTPRRRGRRQAPAGRPAATRTRTPPRRRAPAPRSRRGQAVARRARRAAPWERRRAGGREGPAGRPRRARSRSRRGPSARRDRRPAPGA